MIYELRAYDFRPGTLPEAIERLGAWCEHRRRYSELAGMWRTEVGPLNRVVHLWPYADLAERERVRAAVAQDPNRPKLDDIRVRAQAEVFVPFPFSPQPEPGRHGPWYELRRYAVKGGGAMQSIQGLWEPLVEARRKLSPLTVVMQAEIGELHTFVHIWPYESLAQRAEVRERAAAEGVWPPPGVVEHFVAMENQLLLPVPFSPLQ